MTTTEVEAIGNELKAFVEEQMEHWKVPGVALAVRDGDEVLRHGFGVTSIETGQAVTADTLFRIASITKTFTATLAMMLVEEGLIELDTPVSRYVPDLPLTDRAAREKITMRNLLTHTVGFEGDDWRETGLEDDSLRRYVAGYGDLRQLAPPGEVWAYSNTGLALAGYVVATVLGKPFEEAMRERVFEPLGLERTFMHPHQAIVYPVAIGHQVSEGEVSIIRRYVMSRGNAPAGNIISTVDDLTTYAAFHMGDGT